MSFEQKLCLKIKLRFLITIKFGSLLKSFLTLRRTIYTPRLSLVTKITIAVFRPFSSKIVLKNILIILLYQIDILTFRILSKKTRQKNPQKNPPKNPVKNPPKFFYKKSAIKSWGRIIKCRFGL